MKYETEPKPYGSYDAVLQYNQSIHIHLINNSQYKIRQPAEKSADGRISFFVFHSTDMTSTARMITGSTKVI